MNDEKLVFIKNFLLKSSFSDFIKLQIPCVVIELLSKIHFHLMVFLYIFLILLSIFVF